MSDEKEKPSTERISLSKSELKSLLAETVAAAVAASNEKAAAVYSSGMEQLAAALLESRKPYIDPGQVENEKSMRKSMREALERMRAQIYASQQVCPHLQGSSENSDFTGQLSSIVMHQLDSGVVAGICTNCQLIIYSDDPNVEIQKIFRMKSGNRMSRAGQRLFRDPKVAMTAGRLETPTAVI